VTSSGFSIRHNPVATRAHDEVRVAIDVPLKPVEAILFRSDIAVVAQFRCPATDPLFHDSGPCSNHTFVFPRTMTMIERDDDARFVGSPNIVGFYNQHQQYRRKAISAVDATDWYVVSDDVLRTVVREFDPAAADHPSQVFRHASAPVEHEVHMLQRRLFESLEGGQPVEPAQVEDGVMSILWRTLSAAYRNSPRLSPRLRQSVVEAQRLIASAPERSHSLRELAAATGTSPFHLCRAFRHASGESITQFRHTLRVRLAQERLRSKRVDLSTLAFELGFSSHSHFTSVFHRCVGMTPSAFRIRVGQTSVCPTPGHRS
jgi:AraC family transcriptional regulator